MTSSAKEGGIIMESKYFYSTAVEWTGERRGDLRSSRLSQIHWTCTPH